MPAFETSMAVLAAVATLSYLLGSVPFGIVITRAFGLGDLRSIGSGNIGTTNVLRTGSKTAAALTLILDSGKGAFAVLLARLIVGADDAAQIAGLTSFLGHLFPIYLRFKGGKGVATFLGTAAALAWPVGMAAAGTWLITALVFRMSSLSALVAAASAPVWALILGAPAIFVLLAVFAALIFVRHKDNISRLLSGTEPKIGKGK